MQMHDLFYNNRKRGGVCGISIFNYIDGTILRLNISAPATYKKTRRYGIKAGCLTPQLLINGKKIGTNNGDTSLFWDTNSCVICNYLTTNVYQR